MCLHYSHCTELACATRWNTTLKCLQYYNQNWSFLAQGAASHLKQADLVRQTLQNNQISSAVVDLLEQMTPVNVALGAMQASEVSIGNAVAIWKKLTERLGTSTPMGKIVATRLQQATIPHFMAAFFLQDTAKQPAEPDALWMGKAVEFFAAEGLLPEFSDFQARAGPWRGAQVWGLALNVSKWWAMAEALGMPAKLCQTAKRLCSMRATTADLERRYAPSCTLPIFDTPPLFSGSQI
jgi:hypothetical protein